MATYAGEDFLGGLNDEAIMRALAARLRQEATLEKDCVRGCELLLKRAEDAGDPEATERRQLLLGRARRAAARLSLADALLDEIGRPLRRGAAAR